MSKVFICHISNVLDYGTAYRSVAELIEDTCANLNSEKINSIWAKMADVAIVLEGETDEKIQDYAVTPSYPIYIRKHFYIRKHCNRHC